MGIMLIKDASLRLYRVPVSGTQIYLRPSPPLTAKRRKPLAVPILIVGTPNGDAEIAAIVSSTPSLSLGKTRKTQCQR
jgi:hypothetical protein